MFDKIEFLEKMAEKHGRYFINPENAELKSLREWTELGKNTDLFIELSPVDGDNGEIEGFALHLDVSKLSEIKKFHPIIEAMIAKSCKEITGAALKEENAEKRNQMLYDVKRIAEAMLKYYVTDKDGVSLEETAINFESAQKDFLKANEKSKAPNKTLH